MDNTISTAKIHENLSLQNLHNEIFKDIPEYEGFYQVSNFGRVKSLKRKGVLKDRIRKAGKDKGVSFNKSSGKYQARKTINGKQKYLGRFQTEFEAHIAYKNAI